MLPKLGGSKKYIKRGIVIQGGIMEWRRINRRGLMGKPMLKNGNLDVDRLFWKKRKGLINNEN